MIAAQLGYPKIVGYLLGHQGIKANLQNPSGYTALYIAASQGFADVVKILLATLDIDVTLADYEAGRSALHVAAEEDKKDIVDLCLRYSLTTSSLKDHQGGTAMLPAIDEGCDSVTKTVAEYNLDFQCVDSYERSLLHAASAMGHFSFVRLLRTKGVNENAQDDDGFTALHDACRNGRPGAVQVLLTELKADLSIKNKYSRTPFRVAWECGHTSIMDILSANNLQSRVDATVVHHLQIYLCGLSWREIDMTCFLTRFLPRMLVST